MADGIELDAGTGGATVATDDDGTAHHQYVKLEFGADNTQTKVAENAPLPVKITDGTDDALVTAGGLLQVDASGAAVPVTDNSGSLTVDNGGTFAVQVDGSALTSLQLADDVVYVDDADWTDGTSKHTLVGGLYQSTPQTVTDGDVAPFNITENGALHVAQQGTVTVSGTVTANLSATDNGVLDNIDADLTTVIGHVDGIEGLLTTIDGDTGTLAGAVSGTEMQVDVVAALPAGTNSIGGVTVRTNTTGGASTYSNTDVQETDAEIKDTGGTVYTIYAWNMTAAPLWLKFYDADADDVTPGTTAPTFDLMIPANADSDGAGVVIPLPPQGINFTNAITISGSTTRGTTAADVGTAGNLGVFVTYA